MELILFRNLIYHKVVLFFQELCDRKFFFRERILIDLTFHCIDYQKNNETNTKCTTRKETDGTRKKWHAAIMETSQGC